ncbi:MAG: di-heme oxidoredictase family protein [Bacteroidales bacterium]|nr:di-heme oxidoredictase family protein [Bacteroidales bacterium]
MKKLCYLSALIFVFVCISCEQNRRETKPVELSEEYYSGGKLGTVFNATSFAYEQPAPAVENAGMAQAFREGEYIFEKDYNTNASGAFHGLGPVMVRRGCTYCHPNYGHGARQTSYNSSVQGNGYLLVITDDTDTYLSSVTGMPQTQAVAPFKAPIDETQIQIDWLNATDDWGNTFPDGEQYSLIYPEVTIPLEAFYVPLEVTKNGETTTVPYDNMRVRLESTIGMYGTGLLDAIPDDSITEQWRKEEAAGVPLNPAMFAGGTWQSYYANSLQGDGTKYVRRFTYALSRGPLLDAPGANAIWDITNVTRSDRRYNYITATYATVSSQDEDVQAEFYKYHPDKNTGNVEQDIYNYLMAKDIEPEMTDEQFKNFMIWHRGLAVPAARNLDDPQVMEGKEKFMECGCAYCHRPSWTTGDDHIQDPNLKFSDNDMPRYPHHKIWPYTDLVQHRLYMKNDIRTGWCRTTPLWGRGLSRLVTGADDRLHDCRARTVIEAIMWHGYDSRSDARESVEKFRQLTKEQRDAVVAFIEAI